MAKQATSRAPRASSGSRKKSAPPPKMTVVPALREPSYQEIAEHAYGLYLARGGHEGDAFGDWVRAERELRATLVA